MAIRMWMLFQDKSINNVIYRIAFVRMLNKNKTIESIWGVTKYLETTT